MALLSLSALVPCTLKAKAEQNGTPASFIVISPIFGQLVAFSQPSDFFPVFEDVKGTSYMREAVPKGETVNKWTQMITVTGAKGLATNPNVSPARFADLMAGGFKKSCPRTFSAISIGNAQIAGHDAFVAVASCGTITFGGGTHAETALIVAIKGASDFYTLQWAERSQASAQPIEIDRTAWTQRLAQLDPIRLCPIVPGEKAPYPSCLGRK